MSVYRLFTIRYLHVKHVTLLNKKTDFVTLVISHHVAFKILCYYLTAVDSSDLNMVSPSQIRND